MEAPGVGICLDFGHAHMDGDLVDGIETVSELLIAIHLHDNHGAFAKALIEAFGEGRGAVNGILKTDDLDRYLKARVPELTKLIGKVQEPESNKPKPVDDFPIAVVRL